MEMHITDHVQSQELPQVSTDVADNGSENYSNQCSNIAFVPSSCHHMLTILWPIFAKSTKLYYKQFIWQHYVLR